MVFTRSYLKSVPGASAIVGAGAVILLAAAFHNGYPLVYSDTGTYVNSGFEGTLPVDRPIGYGLFLRHASLAVTLWGPVLAQALLLAWLLWVLLRTHLGDRPVGKFLFALMALCLLTALPWYVGQLMPDVFTAMQVLVVAIVLTRPVLSRALWAVLGVLFVVCCLVHFSNLFIGLLSLAGLALWRWGHPAARAAFPGWRPHSLALLLWCLSAFVALPTLNWVVAGEFVLGKGSATFIMGRMVDSGMLKMYLDDKCATNNYRLCQYRDSLPQNSRRFHWEGDSPLYREGGWGASEAEYWAIVRGTFSSPKYLGLHVWESLLSTPAQLMQNAVGSGLDYGWYRSPESPPYQVVQRYFPHEFNEYINSRQCGNPWKQTLDFSFFNEINYWVLGGTVLLLVWLTLIAPLSGPWLPVLWVFVAGILSNAFVTSSLAVICDRFSPRVVWLLTLWVLVALFVRYGKRAAKASNGDDRDGNQVVD